MLLLQALSDENASFRHDFVEGGAVLLLNYLKSKGISCYQYQMFLNCSLEYFYLSLFRLLSSFSISNNYSWSIISDTLTLTNTGTACYNEGTTILCMTKKKIKRNQRLKMERSDWII